MSDMRRFIINRKKMILAYGIFCLVVILIFLISLTIILSFLAKSANEMLNLFDQLKNYFQFELFELKTIS